MKAKRVAPALLVLMATLLTGCFGGTNIATPLGEGTVLVNVRVSGSIRDKSVGPTPKLIPVEATHVRVRVFSTKTNTNIVKEVALPADGNSTSLELRVPVGIYTIQALSYRNVSSRGKPLLTFGATDNIVIRANETTAVQLTPDKVPYTITTPTEPIEGGTQYTISYTIDTDVSIPFGRGGITTSFRHWADDNLYPSNTSFTYADEGKVTLNARSESNEQTVYYQFYVLLSNDFALDSEVNNAIALFFPSLTAGESLGELTITPPTGGVIVDID